MNEVSVQDSPRNRERQPVRTISPASGWTEVAGPQNAVIDLCHEIVALVGGYRDSLLELRALDEDGQGRFASMRIGAEQRVRLVILESLVEELGEVTSAPAIPIYPSKAHVIALLYGQFLDGQLHFAVDKLSVSFVTEYASLVLSARALNNSSGAKDLPAKAVNSLEIACSACDFPPAGHAHEFDCASCYESRRQRLIGSLAAVETCSIDSLEVAASLASLILRLAPRDHESEEATFIRPLTLKLIEFVAPHPPA